MITLKGLSIASTLIFSMASFSHAESLYSEKAVDKTGALGIGLDLSTSFTLSINGRLGNKLQDPYKAGSKVADDYRLDLSSFAAMIDWHPGGSGFRVSAGLLYNGSETRLANQPSNTDYLIGKPGYTAYEIDSLTDRINKDSASPYLGIGWRNKIDERGGLSFSAEAGVLFQGNSSSRLTSTDGLATNPDLYQEEENILDHVSDKNEIYPVLNLGISYTY